MSSATASLRSGTTTLTHYAYDTNNQLWADLTSAR
jgi:hypothetical protein